MKAIDNNPKFMRVLMVGALCTFMTPFVANAQLEEIVVTAEKRSENLQDIGLSVTGISSDGLRKGGITDVTRVDLLVPGVNFAFIGNDAKINVRGANSNNTFVIMRLSLAFLLMESISHVLHNKPVSFTT